MPVVVTMDFRPLDKLTEQTRPRAEALLKQAAFEVEAEAKKRAPVDTGALRNSLTTEGVGSQLYWQVHDGVEYGIFQELGTSRMAAQPFLVPAVESLRGKFERLWAELFRL